MTSTELKHQAQIAKWTELIKRMPRRQITRLKHGASRHKFQSTLSMGAEYTDKCRNESAFGKNGFRRGCLCASGEPKRFSTFRDTPYR